MTGRLRHGGSAKWNAPRVTENPGFDETAATAKWLELAPLLDRMMQRVGTDGEFGLAPGSSLAGDDQASAPYQLSHAVRACLMAATDHLHAAKVVVVDQGTVHVAAPSSLARGALETLFAAYWMLHPVSRDERVTRALRWQAQNMRDAGKAVRARNLAGHLSLDDKLASLDRSSSEARSRPEGDPDGLQQLGGREVRRRKRAGPAAPCPASLADLLRLRARPPVGIPRRVHPGGDEDERVRCPRRAPHELESESPLPEPRRRAAS